MFSVYVPGKVLKVQRYYPCTITYTYTTSPTWRITPPTYIMGAKRPKTKI